MDTDQVIAEKFERVHTETVVVLTLPIVQAHELRHLLTQTTGRIIPCGGYAKGVSETLAALNGVLQ